MAEPALAEAQAASVPGEGAADERAGWLAQLARDYAAPLTRFFLRRRMPQWEASDLVQEVFLRLSAIEDSSRIARPQSYLFVTAANVLRDRARRARVREADAHVDLAQARTLPDESASAEVSPLRVLIGREGVELLRAALTQLPERTRDIFVLRAMEEMRMADIARLFEISVRATEKHYAKALVHLESATREWRHL